jgi:hypothetical protein
VAWKALLSPTIREEIPMRVIQGTATDRRPSPLEEAYSHFRLDRQGLPVSPRTLGFYDDKIGGFLAWLRKEHTGSDASRTLK